MKLPLYIAFRYLFAHKSHNVINIISAISATGMAIGTAALILIMSVYNGFDRIIDDNISDLDPDLRIEAAEGRFFDPAPITGKYLYDDRFSSCCEVLEDRAFLSYADVQAIVTVRGVTESYRAGSPLVSHLTEGEMTLHRGDVPLALLGSGLSYRMNIHPRFVDKMQFYYPDKNKTLSVTNPAASLRNTTVFPGGIFSVSTDIDNSLVIIPYENMSELTGEDGASAVELRLAAPGERNVRRVKKALAAELGQEYRVLDHYELHPELFRMMKLEKAAIFLILMFVVIIVAFNIFGSLSMLVIEKKNDIAIFKAMGASDRTIRDIFLLEGWLISLLGLATGLVIGLGLTLAQQNWGLVKLPGNFMIDAYPVAIEWLDVAFTVIGVAAIGLVISLLATRRSA